MYSCHYCGKECEYYDVQHEVSNDETLILCPQVESIPNVRLLESKYSQKRLKI